jgi:hypothetical protein
MSMNETIEETPKLTVSPAVWSVEEAMLLCSLIEGICPKFGCHVALTGGLLYKPGNRKDCDILFYRIRQIEKIQRDELIMALVDGITGFVDIGDWGWMSKATYHGKPVDIFFPEHNDADSEPIYGEEEPLIVDPKTL